MDPLVCNFCGEPMQLKPMHGGFVWCCPKCPPLQTLTTDHTSSPPPDRGPPVNDKKCCPTCGRLE